MELAALVLKFQWLVLISRGHFQLGRSGLEWLRENTEHLSTFLAADCFLVSLPLVRF